MVGLIPGWLRRKPRQLEPVACANCGELPREWQSANARIFQVMCLRCYPVMIGALITSDDSRNDAVRMWNNVHGHVVLDGEEVARFRRGGE